jgi:EpsI family protein
MAGIFSDTAVVEGVALIIGVAGLVLLLLGIEFLKALIFPILYLSFSFPLFDKILAGFSHYFEQITALIAGHFLKIAGIPVLMHDKILELPHISLNVVQACNGINHIIALAALVLFVGYLEQMRYWKIMLLMLIAVVVGIMANGLRVGLIGLWTMYFGTESFHGPFDIFYSSFVFLVGFIVIGLVMPIMKRKEKQQVPTHQKLHVKVDATNYSKKRTASACAAAFGILILTWIVTAFANPVMMPVEKDLNNVPLAVGNWQGRDVETLGEPYERAEGYDSVLRRVYRDNRGKEINLFIGYLNSQKKGREIHLYPGGKLETNNSETDVTRQGNETYRLRTSAYKVDSTGRKAIYFYSVNGNITNHRYKAKLASMIEGILSQKTNAAVIIVSYAANGNNEDPEIEKAALQLTGELIPLIQAVLVASNQ